MIEQPNKSETTETNASHSDETVDIDAVIEEEILVEEVSIDGMCGVY